MKHLTPTEIFQKMYAYYGNKSGLLDNIDLDKVKFIIEKVLEIDPHCETVKKVGKDIEDSVKLKRVAGNLIYFEKIG